MNKKQAWEWVVTMSGGEFHVLTENQYDLYKRTWKEGQIFFDTFHINPSFVSSSFKRKAETIIKKYPCPTCHGTGTEFIEGKIIVCRKCEGSAVSV